MTVKKIGVVFFLLLTTLATRTATAQNSSRAMKKLIDENMKLAVKQYKLLAKNTPPTVMPRNYDPAAHKLVTANVSWWTSGFFPGSLWYLYEYSGDTAIRSEAERRLNILERIKYHTGDHDLGFMIFCSFGNAYRITGDAHYKDVIDTASETLIKRYRPSIRSIQSWDSSKNFRCPVIIDNMMNLEMLCWTSDQVKEPKYKLIAIDHAETTIKNHFRPDYSTYHVIDYDLQTGKVIKKKTAQGYSDESAWARGQSWGLYGYTMLYRMTTERKYLDLARNIAGFLLNHPNLPADKVPYWDYNVPDPAHAKRDVSAGSVMASALLELGQYTEGEEREKYISTARKILQSLSGKTYRSKVGENGGFLLKHSVGSLPHNSEIDVSLTYADYYFIEALLRYKNWYL